MANSILDLPSSRPPEKPVTHLHQVDLARRWKLSERTLERWRWRREGPAFLKIGGRVVYRMEDIEQYEAARLKTPDPKRNTGAS